MTTKHSVKFLYPVLLVLIAGLGFAATQQPQTAAADSANNFQAETIAQTNVPGDGGDEGVILTDDEYPDPFQAAADTIGISIDELWDALDNGQTIAQVAAEHSVDAQTVIDAMVAAEYAFIDQLLAEGDIDEAEAEEWRGEVVDYITDMVNNGFDDDFVDSLAVAAETIGMDIDALWAALDNGQTIAEVAAEHGVDAQTVIDAMVAAESAFIDELLAAGEIDEAEAEEWRSEVVEYITDMVNNGWNDDGVELFFDEACVIEADGASLDQLDIPESCLDGFAVFGATAAP